MKVYVIIASLIAASFAAPSIRSVEERVLRDAGSDAADVERSPATAAELLELRELQLRINAMMAEEEIMNNKGRAAVRGLEGADSLYNLDQERMVEPRISPEERQLAQLILLQMSPAQLKSLIYMYSPLSSFVVPPQDRIMFDRKRYEITPLQQLMLLREEKLVELNKEEDLFDYKKNQLGPVELFKEEKLLELQKEQDLLRYKKHELTPLQELLLIKEEKLLELQKEEDLLEHKENQMSPVALFREEKLLELQKEEDLLKHRKATLTPLQEMALFKREKLLDLEKEEKMLDYERSQLNRLQDLELLRKEKLLDLTKDEDMLHRRRNSLTPMQQLDLLEQEKMLDYKGTHLTPLQQLALMKEEKFLELHKDDDLYKFKEQETLKEKLIDSLI